MNNMKRRKKWFTLYSWTIIVLTVSAIGLMLFSWLGSLYGLEIQNLLSLDGIRWLLRSSLKQTQEMYPILSLLMLSMALGVCHRSGWLTILRFSIINKLQLLSYKQRWSLHISVLVGAIYLVFVLWGAVTPNWNMLSITGSFTDSPLMEGFPIWFSLGCMLVSTIYGLLSGNLRSIHEMAEGMIDGVYMAAPFLVLLFIAIHFIQICLYIF